jgi:hypothetical protein
MSTLPTKVESDNDSESYGDSESYSSSDSESAKSGPPPRRDGEFVRVPRDDAESGEDENAVEENEGEPGPADDNANASEFCQRPVAEIIRAMEEASAADRARETRREADRQAMERLLMEPQPSTSQGGDRARLNLPPGNDWIPPKANASAGEKLSSVGKLPSVPEFGTYPGIEQYGHFREWMRLVNAALRFVPDWTEELQAAWFEIVMGQQLRTIILAYQITPPDDTRPFSSLVAALFRHFIALVDPAISMQRFQECKQEAGETTAAFFVRLMETTRHSTLGEDMLRTHFLLNLRDETVRQQAILADWSMKQTVEGATRREAMEASRQRSAPVANAVNAVQASDVPRGRFPRRPGGPPDRTREAKKPRYSEDRKGNAKKETKPCRDCNFEKHRSKTCPATGKICLRCDKLGHFASVCPQAGDGRKPDDKGRVNQVRDENEEDWS